ncbi:hypothetical protein [uncultured Flavobacterium sp.]|uniref:hypothetical protein n=1 Tax=uncultured Flavobacterium sp. TaxID=165435 RepID=UPI0025FF3511|nr:hypothetical protein [uncultured Flavobacterium sp.]
MKIKLQTGRIVEVEAFSMNRTYGGLLLGEPNEAINDRIISSISYCKDWENRKALLEKKNMYSKKNVLKPVIYTAWLTSESVSEKSKINDTSSIVLLWFGEELKGKSISDIIIEGISNFNWDKNAENIKY